MEQHQIINYTSVVRRHDSREQQQNTTTQAILQSERRLITLKNDHTES